MRKLSCSTCQHRVVRIYTERRLVRGEAGFHEQSAAQFMPVLLLHCGHAPSVAAGADEGERMVEHLSVEHIDGVDHVSDVLRTIQVGAYPEAVDAADLEFVEPPGWCRLRRSSAV